MTVNEAKSKLEYFVDKRLRGIVERYSGDFDELLDKRDDDVFSDEWEARFDKVETTKSETDHDEKFSDLLRKKSFKMVIEESSSSDVAAYISDDIGMIHDALQAGLNDSWINALWLEYKSGRIPSGALTEAEGTLLELIAN